MRQARRRRAERERGITSGKPTFARAENEPSLVALDRISDALAEPVPILGPSSWQGLLIMPSRSGREPAADRRPANLSEPLHRLPPNSCIWQPV